MSAAGAQPRRNIFITGGASGIGRAVARLFGERGWFVSIADVDVAGMEDTLGQIGRASCREECC